MKNSLYRFILRERPWMWKLTLVVLLLAGFGLRLVDLTDLPLDFASTRQLYSALKARAMYYQYLPDAPAWQQEIAARGNFSAIEPPVMEILVSQTWRLTGEYLWIARIYSSLFWVLGGMALFFLTRELTSTGSALISTLIYLFVPFGVIASRAFQPDPLMVALIIFSLWALLRWQNTTSWKWALLFGLFSGLALFVKNLSVFIVVGAFLGVILSAVGFRRALRSAQVWIMSLLLILPVAIYSIIGLVSGSLGGQFSLRFFPSLWLDPSFYFSWQSLMTVAVGFGIWFSGFIGIYLADRKKERPILVGMWLGYLVFGFTFSYHFITHDYYHLPFIPVAVLSFAPVIRAVISKFDELNPGLFPRIILVLWLVAGTAVQSYISYGRLTKADYRNEVAFWQEIGDKLGHESNVIGLTQDYGYRLAFWGWQSSSAWYTTADMEVRYLAGQQLDVTQLFSEDIAGKDFFVVTTFGEFDSQPVIKETLYSHYPVYAETDEYVIFDLNHPK
jgi:4-amino-4-deoxy-L-arabinose transferase-like glycosyltransferase